MLNGVGNKNALAAAPVAADPAQRGAASGPGGLLANEKDAKEASTAPKFGEVWDNIQAKYGARPEKPREIHKTLGKDDFLRMMITQMKHQDPTEPFKAEQFAAQMAQFSSVEQLQNLNQAVKNLATQNQPVEHMAMTNLIGKSVTIDRERFPHTEGTSESLNFVLPSDATTVKLAVVSDSGETILEKELGPKKLGENAFSWDGVKTNTLPAKTGTYTFRVEAKNEHGQTLQTTSRGQSRVIGVSFEGAEPVFLVGNPNSPEKVTFKNIIRIDSGPQEIPGARSLAAVAAAQNPLILGGGPPPPQAEQPAQAPSQPPALPQGVPPKNFIAFKKGEGSSNLDLSSLPPEAREAIAKFHMEQAQQAQQPQPPVEKGFPNGLKDAVDEKPAEKIAQQPSQQPIIQKGGMNK